MSDKIIGHKIIQTWDDGETSVWEVEITDDFDAVYLQPERGEWTRFEPGSWPAIRDAINDLMGKVEARKKDSGNGE